MAFYPIADGFDDAKGRWYGFEPWDATLQYNSTAGFLATQQHVDIRSFRSYADLLPRPQRPDLEVYLDALAVELPQVNLELFDGVAPVRPQTDLEVKAGEEWSEQWVLTGTGTDTLVVGKDSTRGGWFRLKVRTTGTAINAQVRSSMPSKKMDISTMDKVSFVLPDYNTLDAATSYIQFTSSSDGTFSGNNSAQVFFNANVSSLPEVRVPVSAFANAGFDNKAITGVKVGFVKAASASANQTITLMAIRAVKDAWVPSALDFDTILGWLVPPPTLDGNAYGGTVAKGTQFVRGDGTRLDPIPADGSYTLFFSPGGETSPNDATGTNYNDLSINLREQKDIGDGIGSVMVARLRWNGGATKFDVRVINTTGGSPGAQSTTSYPVEDTGIILDPLKLYAYQVTIIGTGITARLVEIARDLQQEGTVWQSLPVSHPEILYRNGRVGFVANFLTRDAYVMSLAEANVGFSILETQVKNTRHPVDGIKLSGVYSLDANEFDSVSGDAFRDPTKTTSGLGSFKTTFGITTNQFIADDWTHLYLSLDMFLPNTLTPNNGPKIFLNQPEVAIALVMPRLQSSQWQTLFFDLGIFRDLLVGIGYSFSILPNPTADRALGPFWVDNIKIARRRVAWSARATATGPYRLFWRMASDPNGAVHFNEDERGTEVQIKAEALTQDAWVSSFIAELHYAELGLPVFDENYETR